MKWFSALVIMFSTIHTTNAGVFQDIDELLLEEGIVDHNYVYIDEKRAYEVFKIIGNAASKSLPSRVDEHAEITYISVNPYMASYYYTMDIASAGESLETARESFNEIYYRKKLCAIMYDGKFQKANNFVFYGFFQDTKGALIHKIILNKDVCRR